MGSIARRAGELGRRFRASQAGIDAADLAMREPPSNLEATLATANVKHFPMFPEAEGRLLSPGRAGIPRPASVTSNVGYLRYR